MLQAPKGGAIYIGAADQFPFVDNILKAEEKAVQGVVKGDMMMSPPDASMPGCSQSSCTSSVDTLFLMNTAEQGGAVYVDDSSMTCSDGTENGGTIDVTNSRFQNNSAEVRPKFILHIQLPSLTPKSWPRSGFTSPRIKTTNPNISTG